MTNKNMHAFVGEVIEPNQSDVSPIVCITAGSDNHPTSVSEAAHMLVAQQKAQGRTEGAKKHKILQLQRPRHARRCISVRRK